MTPPARSQHAEDFLHATVGDTVDPAEVGVIDADGARSHIAGCAACATLRDAIRGGAATAERLYATDAAGDVRLAERVTARLEARRRIRRLVWTVGAAAAVLVTAVTVNMIADGHRRAGQEEVVVAKAGHAVDPRAPGLVAGYAGPHFVDVTASSGIADTDHTGVEGRKDWMVETVGHGAAVIDFDGDGDLDLFVPDGNRIDASQHVRDGWKLYRNDGGMHFTDVTKGSGLESDAWAGGAVVGDVNGDARPDIYVPCFGANHLFLNRGEGKFEDVTEKAGVAGAEQEWSTAACMADFDGDGSLDLYVSNYADMRRFMSEAAGPRGCKWRDMPVACGPQPLEPQQNRLFLNRGDGTFTDATATGLPKLRRYSFQCVAADFNGDGAPDVFVATDSHPNLLLLNDGHGHFVDQAMSAGVAADSQGHEQACMGAAVGDVDGDGLTDLFVTNFSHEPNVLYRSRGVRAPGQSGVPSFSEVTSVTGLVESEALLGWGASFLDFDADGALDLLFANGHLYPDVESQVPTTTYEQPLSLYRNDGAGRFREISASAGRVLVENRVHRGLVVADLDDDGRPDAFVTVLNGRALLLRNDGASAGNWLQISLRSPAGRGEPAGAHVAVTVKSPSGTRTVARDLVLGSSFGACEDPRLTFGLADAKRVESIEIRWPHGELQRLGALDSGHLYVIEAASSSPRMLR